MAARSILAKKSCVPCPEGTMPFNHAMIQRYLPELANDWRAVGDHHLEKEYTFPDFRFALHFANLVGELAERENHHPDIHLSWGKVKLIIWSHNINGLCESDFILAAKCDEQYDHQGNLKACF